MKRSFVGLLGSGLAGLLYTAAATVSAAEPVPALDFDFSKSAGGIVKDSAKSGLSLKLGADAKIEDGALTLTPSEGSFAAADEAAFKAWAKNFNCKEMASSFWIRFDKTLLGGGSNSDSASLGLFDCYLDKDGHISVKVFTKKTELLKPVVMKSTFKAEYGKWYHVEFSYSMNSRCYKLYIDGKFQIENDKILMPFPAVGDLKLGNGFRGAVKDLKFYDAALDSEELALTEATDADFDASAKKAADIAASTKNIHLKAWANELAKRARTYKADKGRTTVAAVKRLNNAIGNAEKLAAGISDSQNTIADKVVTAYVTPATTQALYLPYNLPENGSITNKMELIMAQDEFETSSVIVVPFKPVKQFTLKMGDLKNGKNVIKGSDVDIKLVKRWFRTGGAWMSYHVDLYMRVLTPDMLLNDDTLVEVDEFRRTNKVRFAYPSGPRYVDVSEFNYNRQWLKNTGMDKYFYDAPTLQPLTLKEAGRNQQYIVTFRTQKDTAPGFYDGKLQLLADGKDAGTINVTIRVLPFVLPQPKAFDNTSMTYLSHINSWDGKPSTLKNAKDHNLMHLSRIASSPERIRECAKQGYPLEIIFESSNLRDAFNFGGPDEKRTPAMEKQMEDMVARPFLRHQQMIEKNSPARDYICYRCQTSEASWYGAISRNPDRISRVLREKTKFKLFAHGMTLSVPYFSPGIYDMNSDCGQKRELADIWHSFGGRAITYAFPFPGPENPGLMRRALGIELYIGCRYDGHMMHGYVEDNLNEFSKYPGGDGDYRSFCLAYGTKDGCINRIAIVGVREAYDDVRYTTMMKVQAETALKNSKDELVRREATRQLAWLSRVNGYTKDMDAYLTQVQYRIMALKDLMKEREGK